MVEKVRGEGLAHTREGCPWLDTRWILTGVIAECTSTGEGKWLEVVVREHGGFLLIVSYFSLEMEIGSMAVS